MRTVLDTLQAHDLSERSSQRVLQYFCYWLINTAILTCSFSVCLGVARSRLDQSPLYTAILLAFPAWFLITSLLALLRVDAARLALGFVSLTLAVVLFSDLFGNASLIVAGPFAFFTASALVLLSSDSLLNSETDDRLFHCGSVCSLVVTVGGAAFILNGMNP